MDRVGWTEQAGLVQALAYRELLEQEIGSCTTRENRARRGLKQVRFFCKRGKAGTWGGSVSRCYFSHLHAVA